MAQVTKSIDLNSCLQGKDPSELGAPPEVSVGWGGDPWWLLLDQLHGLCTTAPPWQTKRGKSLRQPRKYRTAAVTLSWLGVALQSPDGSWNIACPF